MAYRAPFKINNSTGSDSSASGIGPSTALTGSYAYSGGYTTTISLQYDSPDLSGVQAGDCIYIASLSGTERCFLEIASVNNTSKTVTVTTTVQYSLYGVSWAIGGKRAFGNTSAGRSIFDQDNTDGVDNISVEIEYTGTDYTQSSGCTFYENVRVFGTGSQMPRLKCNASSMSFFTNDSTRSNLYTTSIENLWFINNNSATSTKGISASDGMTFVDSCKFGDEANTTQLLNNGVFGGATDIGWVINNCEFHTKTAGANVGGSDCWFSINNCTFSGSTYGVLCSSSTARATITNSAFSSCMYAIHLSSYQMASVCNNAISAGSRAYNVGVVTNTQDACAIFGNVFVGSSIGIDHQSAGENKYIRASRNYWQGNTTKWTTADYDDVYNITDDFDVDLATDPFNDEANDDLSLNDTAGADTLKAVTTVNTTDQQLTDIRPLKYLDTSSGGGSIIVIEE